MKISIEPYTPTWAEEFSRLKTELEFLLPHFQFKIEHIGSTSVPGLAAKPIIDIMVGIQDTNQFPQIIQNILTNPYYIYYQAFNEFFPERRLFVKLKKEVNEAGFPNTFSDLESIPHDLINPLRIAHIHIWPLQSEHWLRHLAFREYLKVHKEVRDEYAQIKKELGKQEWEHGMAYNEGKDAFIKREEKKAVLWYQGKLPWNFQ
ncbi:MAG: GrpB family protein [Bacteroidetes bacterium]|nr:GrpB family protein [Bacteroidota bacterium]